MQVDGARLDRRDWCIRVPALEWSSADRWGKTHAYSGRLDRHHQAFAERGQGNLDLLDLRAVFEVEKAIHLALYGAQRAAQIGLAHTLFPHSVPQRDLRVHESGQPDNVLTLLGWRRSRNRAQLIDIDRQSHLKNFSSLAQQLFERIARAVRFWDVVTR